MKPLLPLIFTLARIENLMHQVSFDPVKMNGKIITNTSQVKKERLDETLNVFYDAIQSGLAVSPMIKIVEEKGSIKIKTACSLTICGVFAQAWHTGAP